MFANRSQPIRRVLLVSGLLVVVLIGGAAWYTLVEGFTPLEGAYQAVTTVSTVGFSEVQPLDTSGQIFTMGYILVGVGLLFWDVTAVVELLLLGAFAESLGLRRLRGRVKRMNDHYIVCGIGRVGQEVVAELQARGRPFVAIDTKSEVLNVFEDGDNAASIVGDATEEEVLRTAGIDRARALIAAADSDTGNTYIVLTARSLNPGLLIVARAGSSQAEHRMRSAGANRVISPYRLGGRRLALSAVEPMLVDFVDHLADHRDASASSILAEIQVDGAASRLSGQRVVEAFPPGRGVHLMGIERQHDLTVGPGGDYVIESGDRLIVYGNQAAVEAMAHADRVDG